MGANREQIIVFTDGACLGNPGPGGYGLIISHPDGSVQEWGGAKAATTNNRMELLAVHIALEKLQNSNFPILLYTDSKYVIQGVQSWLKNWQRTGWKTMNGKAVEHQDLWKNLAAMLEKRPQESAVEWVHIPGHSEIPANERCDKIATAFAAGKKVLLFTGARTNYSVDLKIPENSSALVEWRRKAKKGQVYYLSYVNNKVERHATWSECEARVKGVAQAKFQKCADSDQEREILQKWGVPPRNFS